jgi:DNA polymerase-3 subunit gamma/tau
MAHRVISLKYRPQHFDELTGQNHVVVSLKGAIKSGRIGHAFLFAGPRGVGKTTTARILSKSLNCIEGPTVHPCQQCQSCREITLSRSIDVIEIDGASNRGIEEIRNLREGVKYSPIHGQYKIYIIDEVHMLTQEAFNALLKTLEEPPPKVIFIFATTNPTKVPATILSRCQRFIFKRLSVKEITRRLQLIAERENIKLTKDALHYIAIRADGSIRDGESILEQLAAFVEDEITADDVFKLIGFLGSNFYLDLIDKILAQNLAQVISGLNKGLEDGADPIEVYRGLTNYLRATLLLKTGLSEDFIEMNAEEINKLKALPLTKESLISMLDICLRFEEMIRRSVNIRIAIELLLSQLVLSISHLQEHKSKNEDVIPAPNNTNDLKSKLLESLQKKSPKLAGVVQKSAVTEDAHHVIITVEDEFSEKQLIDNRRIVELIVKEKVNPKHTLIIQRTHGTKKVNGFVDAIKTMFDGEEIR